MTHRPGDTVHALSLGTCPECGRAIGFVVDDDGQPEGVSHGLPMCDRFDALDPTEYLAWVRGVREATARPVGEA